MSDYCGSNTVGYAFGAKDAVAYSGGITPYKGFSGGGKRKSRKTYKKKKIKSKKYKKSKRVSKRRRSLKKSGGSLLSIGIPSLIGILSIAAIAALVYHKNKKNDGCSDGSCCSLPLNPEVDDTRYTNQSDCKNAGGEWTNPFDLYAGITDKQDYGKEIN